MSNSICFAQGVVGSAAEVDSGLADEAIPVSTELKIPNISFKLRENSPVIDGVLDDEFWNSTQSFELSIELYPTRLAPAVVKTHAKMAVTASHIYVSFMAEDPNPDDIRSAIRRHDANKEDDYVSVIIDPIGTLAKKYEFRVNPHGTKSDVLQDTISDRYIYDWDTEWEAAAQITEQGYTVEIGIPVSSIRSPADAEDILGAVILKRSYPRVVDRTLATFFKYNKNQDGKAETLPNKTKSNLKLVPHYIFHQDEERSINGIYEQVDEHSEHEVGLDAEYNFSSSESLSLTINPSYVDVERDLARDSINNQFNRFVPEKRSFFKPVTEYYNSLIPTVYTDNIVSPEVGLSYTNDFGVSSLSGFAVSDNETKVIIPDNLGSDEVELLDDSTSSAFRYRYSKDRKTIGLIGTYRTGDDYQNSVLGVDGLVDLGPDDKIRYQVLYSDTQYPERFADDLCESDDCTTSAPADPCPIGGCAVNAQVLRADFTDKLNGHGLQLRYKHDGPEGLYWVGYEEYSPDYRSDLGFQTSVDIRSINFAYGEKWYFESFRDDQGLSRFRAYLIGRHTRSYEDDHTIENAISIWGEFRGTHQTVFRVGKRIQQRAVNRIDQSSLATGDNAPLFDEDYIQWYYEISPRNNWTFNFDGRYGDIADADNMVLGEMTELKPKIKYRFGDLEFTAGGIFRDFEVDDERLYHEQFLTFTTLYRQSDQFFHRLLYLDDITKEDTTRWMGSALEKEVERTLEYTFLYKPNKSWKILAGAKLEYEYASDVDDGDLTNREIYIKFEKQFSSN